VPPRCVVSFTGCQFDSGFPTRLLSSLTRHVPPANRLTSLTSCKTTDQPEHYDHRINCYCLYRGWRIAFSVKAFSVSAPSVWNSLSYQCRSDELFSSFRRILTSSSAVAEMLRDASCLSVVSFNSTKRRVESFIVKLLTLQICHCADKCAILLSLV